MIGKNDKGQSLVEFALVIPILLLLLLGIVGFGMLFNAHVTLIHSAREGARFGAMPSNSEIGDIQQRVVDTAIGLNLSAGNVIVERDTTNKTIKVTVKHNFHPVDPVLSVVFKGGPVPMQAEATMALE